MSGNLNIPYSGQYNTATREGHERPPPSFGAPALVWHLAISPHWPEDATLPDDTLEDLHRKLAGEYESVRGSFLEGINCLLRLLQTHSGYPQRPRLQIFEPNTIPLPWMAPRRQQGDPFMVTEPSTIRFTLWWRDDDNKLVGEPSADALRIKVHAEAHRDFVTISLYLDAGSGWRESAIVGENGPRGVRRKRIFSEVCKVQEICEGRLIANGGARPVDRPLLPEEDISEQQASDLMGASRYLYSEIWDEFCAAFAIADFTELIAKDAQGRDRVGGGRVFANFRGLAISTRGLEGREEPFPGSSGVEPFARFAGNGGINLTGAGMPKEPNESNAVVKAFWPFIRRVTPFADLGEFIACGVMNWRALYLSALGSPRAFDWKEEGQGVDSFIPAKHLPEELIGPDGRYDSLSGDKRQNPLRYLLLTKGEPHRQQIGRIADRINIMGTMRLIALRDWTIIRDASTQIQLRGLELDTIMRKWSVGSRNIRRRYKRFRWIPVFRTWRRDNRDERLQELATDVEQDLIYLSAALDEVGSKAVHGLPFRINRSRFYIAEFTSLLEALNIGNIDTWLAYDQFVTRGLKPVFDFIDGVGARLLGLRNRLQSVLEGIETSALVIQTAATRSNTAQLGRLAWSFKFQNVVLAVVGLVVTYSSDSEVLKRVLAEVQVYIIWLWEIVVTHMPKGT